MRRGISIADREGGVLLYFVESLDVIENPELLPEELNKIEAIWVELIVRSQRLKFSTMYRPPSVAYFYLTLEKQLEYVCTKKKNVMIMGDFNTNLLNMKVHAKVADDYITDRGKKLTRIL